MRRPLLLLFALAACPPAPTGLDASVLPVDSGAPDAGARDAGKPDAGKPDAGPPDAGIDAGLVAARVSDWCRLLARAQCLRDLRCLELSLPNLDECVAKRAEGCDQTAYTRAAAEGRLQYLEPKAVECLNGYGQGSCTDAPAPCEVVFGGKVPPDGGCILPEECNSAGFCYQYDYTCPHRCRGWLPMGSPCDGFSTRCDPAEAFCGTVDGGGNQERCQPLRGTGDSCLDFDSCRPDLACGSGSCVKRSAGPGEPCNERANFPFCPAEYFCRQDLTVTPALPGSCERKGGLGAGCSGSASCLPSLRCGSALATSTCVVRTPEGAPCSTFGECEKGLYCPPRTSRCAQLPRDGGDCTSHGSYYECASGQFCDFNAPSQLYTCQSRLPVGETCSYDAVCLSNVCDYGPLPDGGFGGTCSPRCSQLADGGF